MNKILKLKKAKDTKKRNGCPDEKSYFNISNSDYDHFSFPLALSHIKYAFCYRFFKKINGFFYDEKSRVEMGQVHSPFCSKE